MPLNNPITSALLADPEIFQQNRLPFHAHYADETSPEMPLAVSLDGEWACHYAENLTAHYADWDTLTVPGFIQKQGLQEPGQPYGTPHYVNTQYPWDGHEKLHPDQIPQDYNPIGEYQRSFTLPESWASCYLRLNGADSAAAVWCNDVYIGYTEDTFTPAEFDMTAAVHPGENTLTVQVYRFSSGSWLEDQDFWRMSGLFRSVELFTKPEIHLEDVFVKQDFAPDFSSATVTFDCKVSGAGTVSVTFNGQSQYAEVGAPSAYDSGVVFGKGEADPDVEEDVQDVSFTFTVEHPTLWSAEQPNLYEAEIALLNEGALVERTGLKVGLRKFELKERQMLLNGKRIVFKGVNRHEWSYRTGRTVSRVAVPWDVKNLQAHHGNAGRTRRCACGRRASSGTGRQHRHPDVVHLSPRCMLSLRKWLLAGLLVLVPLIITLWVLDWVVGTLDQTLHILPKSWQHDQLFGVHIPGLGVIFALVVVLVFVKPVLGAMGVSIGLTIALYALAKVFEHFDAQVYTLTGEVLSGHSLKHLVASLAAWPVLAAVWRASALVSARAQGRPGTL